MTSPFFEEPYQTRRSYRKSCDRCHASKLKCVSLNPADPFSECVRCNKARLLCSYSPRSAKPTRAPLSGGFGDRLEDCNGIAIPATTSDAFLGVQSPMHNGNKSVFGAGHFTRLRSSSGTAPTTASDAVHVLPFPEGHSGSLDASDQWLTWHPSPSDFTAMSASSLEPDHDPFAELFASIPHQTPAFQDADILEGLPMQPHSSSSELCGLSEEMRLLEHTGRLSKMYAGLRDGSWCHVPQSMQDLSKYPIGQFLLEIKDFRDTLASIKTHRSEPQLHAATDGSNTSKSSADMASQPTSTLLLLAHCYVLMVSIAARQFSDLSSFVRVHKASQWPGQQSEHRSSRSTHEKSDSFLLSAEPLMNNPLGKVYAAAKKCAELLVSVELVLDVPAEWSVDRAEVAAISTTVERANTRSTLFAAPQLRCTSLTSSVLDVLMRHESCGQSGRTPVSIFRTCLQELRNAVKEDLGL